MEESVTKNNGGSPVYVRIGSSAAGFIKKNLAIIIGFAVLCVTISFMTDKFLTVNNILSILRQISTNALLAYGMAYVMITGGIDLSVGSIVAVAGTLSIGFCVSGFPIPVAIAFALFICMLMGFITGFVINKTGMPPFIVTLATMQVGRGIAYIYTGGLPIHLNNDAFNAIGNGYIGLFPIPVLIMILIMLVCAVTLARSRFGKYIYAIGGNREAARFSGVDIFKVEIAVYLISATLSGIAGIVLSARLYSAIPTVGAGFELDAIAATVLGGTSFTGGRGSIGGTMIGVLIIGVINNGLNLLQVPYYYQLILKGLIILLSVYLDTTKRKRMGA